METTTETTTMTSNTTELNETINQLTDSSTINQSVDCTSTTTATATVKTEDENEPNVTTDSDEKKYETIEAIKHPHPHHHHQHPHPHPHHDTHTQTLKSMDKPSMHSSLHLLPNPSKKKGIAITTKLGIFQLVLSVVLSALGGLLIARNASLAMIGSGIWSGVIAGVVGSLGLMNIKPLLNGFLAVSLISVATSTLALAFTGIGLIRDYNLSHADPEIVGAYYAGLGLTFSLVLHLLTSMFSVYYSALRLCSNKTRNHDVNIMNYQKVQDYLKSIQNTGPGNNAYFIGKDQQGSPIPAESLIQGYANLHSVNPKVLRQNSFLLVPPFNGMPPHFMPVYPPPSSYMSSRMMYNSTLPHQGKYHHYERAFRTMDNKERRRNKMTDDQQQVKDSEIKLSYTGLDRDIADSFLRQQEEHAKQHSKDEHMEI